MTKLGNRNLKFSFVPVNSLDKAILSEIEDGFKTTFRY